MHCFVFVFDPSERASGQSCGVLQLIVRAPLPSSPLARHRTFQVADNDASEAAYRLADTGLVSLIQSKHPVSASVVTPADANNSTARVPSNADAATTPEPTALDYTGRSTLALDAQKMCHLLWQGAQIPTRRHSDAPSSATNQRDAVDLSEGAAGDDTRTCGSGRHLTLTASTVKAISKKIERFKDRGVEPPTPKRNTTAEVIVEDERTTGRRGPAAVEEDEEDEEEEAATAGQRPETGGTSVAPPSSLHVDPKLFLHHVHQNATLEVSAHVTCQHRSSSSLCLFKRRVMLRLTFIYFPKPHPPRGFFFLFIAGARGGTGDHHVGARARGVSHP